MSIEPGWNYDRDKDDPVFAIHALCLMLVACSDSPQMSEERLLKAFYLLKTLALSGPRAEAEVDRAWTHAYARDVEEDLSRTGI